MFLKEIAFVLLGLKAGVDAHRVASGEMYRKGSVVNSKLELVFGRVFELAFEGIPGALIQVYAILSSTASMSMMALPSLVLSCLTSGYTVAAVTYDLDTSPEERRINPTMYGMMPDGAKPRALILLYMTVMSCLQLLTRSYSIVLLAMHDSNIVWAYLLGDLSLHILQVVIRGNYFYYLPLRGTLEHFVSFVHMVLIKLLADFTGFVQLRSPHELGGVYFTFSQVTNQLATVLIAFYFGRLSIQITVYTMLGIWCIFVFMFFRSIRRSYLKTFWDWETAKRACIRIYFHEATTDEARKEIVKYNRRYWKHIEADVREFIHERWGEWEETLPYWFDHSFTDFVDEEFIPAKYRLIRKSRSRRAVRSIHELTYKASVEPASRSARVSPED